MLVGIQKTLQLFFILILLAAKLAMPRLAIAQSETTGTSPARFSSTEWRGEYFLKREGGIYFKVKVKFPRKKRKSNFHTTDAQIALFNIIKKRIYIISYPLFRKFQGQPPVWKLPSGKYLVRQIKIVEDNGSVFRWKATRQERREIIIKRQSLSNAGTWVVTPRKKNRLLVDYKMTKNTYDEEWAISESVVAAVINAFNGNIQKNLAGKSIQKQASRDYSDNQQLRSVYTTTRSIAMFFTINLFRHNRHGPAVAQVLESHDSELRNCYLLGLEYQDDLRGNLDFTFLLSKNTGTMRKLKHSGGTIRQAEMIECFSLILAQIQFPVEVNMLGKVSYTFQAH